MKTIFVVYSNSKIKETYKYVKRYAFNTSSDVKKGDTIVSSEYNTPMQVVEVLYESFKYFNRQTGELSNTLNSTVQFEIRELVIRKEDKDVVYDAIANYDLKDLKEVFYAILTGNLEGL